ncbi:MAG: sigma-70 family RNA polymerase sigma factor [Haloechinothrix sp.]
MRHTDDDIEKASRRFEQLADDLDPATAVLDHTDDLRQIATVSEAVRADEARLRESVEVARAHGRSWNQIAIALGVSRQAARQRFTDKAHA